MSCGNEKRVARDFPVHVRSHRLEVVRDDGLYRHLKFRQPGNGLHWFDLLTSPGLLTINGDMGTFVFARVEDMFRFFRRPDGGINPSYWAEKLLSVDRHGAASEFDEHEARKAFAYAIEEWPRPARREAFAELDDTWSPCDSSERDFREAVDSIEIEHDGYTHRVEDFWECDLSSWTYRYVWNLRAIVWGIGQYDAEREPALEGSAS